MSFTLEMASRNIQAFFRESFYELLLKTQNELNSIATNELHWRGAIQVPSNINNKFFTRKSLENLSVKLTGFSIPINCP